MQERSRFLSSLAFLYVQIKSAERGSVSLLPLVVLFGFLLRLVVAEFCYCLEGEGARDSAIVHCTACLLQEPLYIYIFICIKKKEREAYLGEGGKPVLNIYISEVALIFIRAAGLYEGGV